MTFDPDTIQVLTFKQTFKVGRTGRDVSFPKNVPSLPVRPGFRSPLRSMFQNKHTEAASLTPTLREPVWL